jgi:hypothetical protein
MELNLKGYLRHCKQERGEERPERIAEPIFAE